MDNVSDVSANAAPAYVTRAEYAGFWRRLLAYIIDAIIMMFLTAMCIVAPVVFTVANASAVSTGSSLVYLLLIVAIFLLFMLYDSIFLSLGTMATPGKLVLGIKVTDLNGNRISFPRALLRTIFKFGFGMVSTLIPIIRIISLIVLLNPFLIALTEKKQAIHDYIASTVVVQK